MSDRSSRSNTPDETGRFVPKGVDAQSWLGFEQRIQERRFNSLLDAARTAMAAGDGVAARAALEEARQLRPQSEELDVLELGLTNLPSSSSTDAFRSRAVTATLLLVVGVTLLTAIDNWNDRAAARVVRAPSITMPGLRVPLPPIDGIPHPLAARARAQESSIPITTAGLEIKLDGAVTIPDSLRENSETVPEPVPLPPGEIPDDFVYPQVRPAVSQSSRTPAVTPAALSSPPPRAFAAANDAPQPGLPPESTPPAPAAPTAPAATPAAASPAPAPQPVATPAPSPSTAVNPAPRTVAPPSRPAPTPADDDTKVADVLRAYARAYGELNAAAAREVWPSVDERALARAFSTLSSQTVSFADCRIDVRGVTALAACRGYASYVGKVGSGDVRTEPRQWRFELRRVGSDWRIQNAQTSRQ